MIDVILCIKMRMRGYKSINDVSQMRFINCDVGIVWILL